LLKRKNSSKGFILILGGVMTDRNR